MECKATNRRLEGDNDQLKKDILDLKNQVILYSLHLCDNYYKDKL